MAKPKSKWPRYIALFLVTALVTGSLALVLVDKLAPTQAYIPQSIVKLPGRVVSTILKPFQSAFAWASGGISGYLQNWKLSKNIELEYNKLRSQVEELTYESLYNRELEEQISQLQDLLNLQDNYANQNPVAATIIGKETSSWFQKYTIDKGAKDGIKPMMAVVTSQGLVGYTETVNDNTSEVISIIDSRSSVAAKIQSTGDDGNVRGTLGVDGEAGCRMYNLPRDFIPRPGDVVVTSGVSVSFPKGIPIGEVRESTTFTEENKQYVVVEPYADFDHLEYVIVLVVNPPVEQSMTVSNQEDAYVKVPLDTIRPIPSFGRQVEDPNLGAVATPARPNRLGEEDDPESTMPPSPTPYATLAPGETVAPDPELDALMREEQAQEGDES